MHMLKYWTEMNNKTTEPCSYLTTPPFTSQAVQTYQMYKSTCLLIFQAVAHFSKIFVPGHSRYVIFLATLPCYFTMSFLVYIHFACLLCYCTHKYGLHYFFSFTSMQAILSVPKYGTPQGSLKYSTEKSYLVVILWFLFTTYLEPLLILWEPNWSREKCLWQHPVNFIPSTNQITRRTSMLTLFRLYVYNKTCHITIIPSMITQCTWFDKFMIYNEINTGSY